MEKNYFAVVAWGVMLFAMLTAAPMAGFSEEQPAQTLEGKSNDIADSIENYVDDSKITALVKSHFVTVKGLDSLDIKVITENRVVTLKGDVENESQSELAEKSAVQVDGVKSVVNTLHAKNYMR